MSESKITPCTGGHSSASDHGSRCGSRSNTPDRDVCFIMPAVEIRPQVKVFGKRPRQELRATGFPGPASSGRRLFVRDHVSNLRFLVDTGADITDLHTLQTGWFIFENK